MSRNQYSAELFHSCKCILGEGILWNPARNSLFWVDIEQNQLFEQVCHPKSDNSRVWQLDYQVTALAASASSDSEIWMLTLSGLVLFNLETSKGQPLGYLTLPELFRPNDGNPGPGDRYWFGSMQVQPDQRAGSLYSVGVDGDYRVEMAGIGIPNTFVSSADSDTLYISDSMLQKNYKYDVNSGKSEEFLDFSDTPCTPDGGALDTAGNLWIALWDGYAIQCFSPSGEELATIPLPIPRPTNCCFGGRDLKTLFITSAREGLTEQMLEKYPLSGSVFSVNMPVEGAALPVFGGKT